MTFCMKKWPLAKVGKKGWFSQRFAESLGKAWPKKAFPWKLGGLNYGLAMSRFQGSSRRGALIVRVWKRKNVSKDQHLKAKRKCLRAAATEWSVRGGSDAWNKFEDITHECCSYQCGATCTAKDRNGVRQSLAKYFFFFAKMSSVSTWKNLEQPSHPWGAGTKQCHNKSPRKKKNTCIMDHLKLYLRL